MHSSTLYTINLKNDPVLHNKGLSMRNQNILSILFIFLPIIMVSCKYNDHSQQEEPLAENSTEEQEQEFLLVLDHSLSTDADEDKAEVEEALKQIYKSEMAPEDVEGNEEQNPTGGLALSISKAFSWVSIGKKKPSPSTPISRPSSDPLLGNQPRPNVGTPRPPVTPETPVIRPPQPAVKPQPTPAYKPHKFQDKEFDSLFSQDKVSIRVVARDHLGNNRYRVKNVGVHVLGGDLVKFQKKFRDEFDKELHLSYLFKEGQKTNILVRTRGSSETYEAAKKVNFNENTAVFVRYRKENEAIQNGTWIMEQLKNSGRLKQKIIHESKHSKIIQVERVN